MKSDIDVHSYPGWDRELVRTSDELYREHSRDAYVSASAERHQHSASSPMGHLARGTKTVNYDSRNHEFGTTEGEYKVHTRAAYPKHIRYALSTYRTLHRMHSHSPLLSCSANEANVDHFKSYIDTTHHGHDGQEFRVTSTEDYPEPPREAFTDIHRADTLHLRKGTRAINYDRNAHTPERTSNEEFPGYWK
jgi:hypothetical protein